VLPTGTSCHALPLGLASRGGLLLAAVILAAGAGLQTAHWRRNYLRLSRQCQWRGGWWMAWGVLCKPEGLRRLVLVLLGALRPGRDMPAPARARPGR
jgi:hypothetical protein